MNKISSKSYSAIHFRTERFDTIFLYLSSDCNKEVLRTLEAWIDNKTPTAIMGDVNSEFSKTCYLNLFLGEKGFQQMIEKATCDTGSLIDHIYVNQPLKELGISVDQSAAYYSDHDIVTLYINK